MSGILDIFTTIFRADTADLDKGLQESERDTKKLAAAVTDVGSALEKQIKALELQAATVGMSKGEATLYKLAQEGATEADLERARAALYTAGAMGKEESAVASLGKKLGGLLAAYVSIGAVVGGAIQNASDINALAQTSDALNVAIEDLDAFGRAAEIAGGDAQGARDSLTDMAEKIGEGLSDVESGAAKAFKALGIGLKDSNGQAKDALTGLLDLAGAVEGLSKSEAVFKIKELGITDNRTVEMVLKGRKELERMLQVQKDQGVVTKENAEVAKRFTDALNGLRGGFDRLGMGVSTAIMPALTVVVEWLQKAVDWAGEHKDVLVGFFGAIAAVVTAIYLPAMISAAAATLAATWPIIAIVAVIGALAAAFALAYDDIMNFIDGNDSLIGQIFDKYPAVKDVVYSIIDAFKFMGEVIAGVWQMIITGFQQVIDFVGKGVSQIKDGVGKVANFFGIGDEAPEGAEPRKGPTVSRERAPGRDEDVPYAPAALQSVAEGQKQLAAAAASPLNATTSNTISNSVANNKREVNVQIGEVNVETQATDAQGMAKDTAGALSSNLKQIESEFATGRDR